MKIINYKITDNLDWIRSESLARESNPISSNSGINNKLNNKTR